MVSVIIPVYNGEKWLREAIESVLSQTEKAGQIVIVNDGSTDKSLEIALEYPITVINQVNKGLASARNTGIMNIVDDVMVLFLDADDILLPKCIEKIQKIVDETHADIIAPSFKEFGLSEREVILMPNPTLENFKTANRIGYCAAIKRSVLLEVGGYNPKMKWGAEDYDLWFDLLKRGKKIVTIPEVLWMYRTKENSMWTETQKYYKEFMHQIAYNHPEIWT